MSDVIIELLPLIVGAAVVPLYPIVVLLLLQSPGGLLKTVAFVAGGLLVRLGQGVLFGLIFDAADEAHPEDGSELIVSTLLLIVGLLLLITAFKKWRKEEDPDAPPPQRMAALSGLTVLKAAGAGALYVAIAVKQWVFTLSAIGVITEAELAGAAGAGLYLFYVLAAQILVLPPLLAFAIAPRQAAKPLQAAQAWLERYNRPIMITVSLLFGIWFSLKGISGLLTG